MSTVDVALAQLAARQHQVFSREQARAAGLTASALSRRIAAGGMIACGTSALHARGVTLTYRGRLMAGLLDLGPDALVSGRAAAHLHGLDGFGEGPLEFLVPREQRNRKTAGTVYSTSAPLRRLDQATIDTLRCTSATRTIVELLAHATPAEAGDALASATRRRVTAPEVVRRRLVALGRPGRAGVSALDRLLSDGAVESGLERRFLRVVAEAGLPRPLLQRRHVLDGLGVARVDFEFATFPIVVEVGGRRGYLSLDERKRQEHRRNALQLQGRTIYFFTRDDVFEHSQYVVETLLAALRAVVVTQDCENRNLG